jgi:tRNA(adenine34) deaminase
MFNRIDSNIEKIHYQYMLQAFNLAEKAYEQNEVPVGAVVVHDNRIVGRGYNQVETLSDPTAHAEMIAISAACFYARF